MKKRHVGVDGGDAGDVASARAAACGRAGGSSRASIAGRRAGALRRWPRRRVPADVLARIEMVWRGIRCDGRWMIGRRLAGVVIEVGRRLLDGIGLHDKSELVGIQVNEDD